MDDQNPYAPPVATLTLGPPDVSGPLYHPVSLTKFALLYYLTLGLYPIYWFYRHWTLVKEREQSRIWPVPRGIFAIFFAHSLFRRIGASAASKGIAMSWRPSVNATWYVALVVVSHLADRVSEQMSDITPLDFLGLACFVALFLPLRQVQQTINEINSDPQGRLNDGYPIATVLVMVLGGLFWLVALAAILAWLLGVPI